MCSSISCSTLFRHKSDHDPIILNFQLQETNFASQFKFHKIWSSHPDCKAIIENFWNTHVIGCPMVIFNKKLKLLKKELKAWNKNSFRNIHEQVKKAEEKVEQVQFQLQISGYNDELTIQERQAQSMLDFALKIEEIKSQMA